MPKIPMKKKHAPKGPISSDKNNRSKARNTSNSSSSSSSASVLAKKNSSTKSSFREKAQEKKAEKKNATRKAIDIFCTKFDIAKLLLPHVEGCGNVQGATKLLNLVSKSGDEELARTAFSVVTQVNDRKGVEWVVKSMEASMKGK